MKLVLLVITLLISSFGLIQNAHSQIGSTLSKNITNMSPGAEAGRPVFNTSIANLTIPGLRTNHQSMNVAGGGHSAVIEVLCPARERQNNMYIYFVTLGGGYEVTQGKKYMHAIQNHPIIKDDQMGWVVELWNDDPIAANIGQADISVYCAPYF